MITREILQQELNKVDDKYFPLLHKIIVAFENQPEIKKNYSKQEWEDFVNTYFGIFKDDPIERGEQLPFEHREPML